VCLEVRAVLPSARQNHFKAQKNSKTGKIRLTRHRIRQGLSGICCRQLWRWHAHARCRRPYCTSTASLQYKSTSQLISIHRNLTQLNGVISLLEKPTAEIQSVTCHMGLQGLPATQHRWMHLALTPTFEAGWYLVHLLQWIDSWVDVDVGYIPDDLPAGSNPSK